MPSSVDLGAKLEAIVAELVGRGRYNSKSEVLREGVRLVQEREKRLKALDSAIARGVAEADAGLGRTLDDAFDNVREKLRSARRKRG